MPVESSKGCNTALKSCCSVLVHSAHIDTEPPIFFDVDATADPLDATMDRPAVVVNATAAIRSLRDAFTRLNTLIFRFPLMVDEADRLALRTTLTVTICSRKITFG